MHRAFAGIDDGDFPGPCPTLAVCKESPFRAENIWSSTLSTTLNVDDDPGRPERSTRPQSELDDFELPLRASGLGCLVGESDSSRRIYELITRVAPTDSTVFITGETGVGKELVARQLHAMSTRAECPFIPINCGAVPGTLFESELFGHEKGSFTDASRRRDGILRQANHGTLFLDEVTEMPLELQVKLLRVLESGSFTPVGGDHPAQVDLRIVAATNRDPVQAVEEGRLRADLLYRLNVFPIEVPPLRDRIDDIEPLARHLLESINDVSGSSKQLSDAAIERLLAHPWNGNARELRNVIERAAILSGERIETEDLSLTDGTGTYCRPSIRVAVGTSIEDVERQLILATLEHVQGKKRSAASLLGISLKTLYTRLKSYESD